MRALLVAALLVCAGEAAATEDAPRYVINSGTPVVLLDTVTGASWVLRCPALVACAHQWSLIPGGPGRPVDPNDPLGIRTREQKAAPGSPPSSAALSPLDQEALKWANDNLGDPRALLIREKLGLGGELPPGYTLDKAPTPTGAARMPSTGLSSSAVILLKRSASRSDGLDMTGGLGQGGALGDALHGRLAGMDTAADPDSQTGVLVAPPDDGMAGLA